MLSEIHSLNESYSAILSPLELAQIYYEKAMELSNIPGDAGCEEAIAKLDQAIGLNPKYPGFYYQKASILFQFLGFYKAFHSSGIDIMFQNLDIAIELDPDFSDKYCPKGIAHYLRGLVGSIHPRADREMLEKAIADLEIADGLGFVEAKGYLEYAKERHQLFFPDEEFFVDECENKDVQTTTELELEYSNLTADLEKNLKKVGR
jgi:tetratricopeptide (TPR) repeat protein